MSAHDFEKEKFTLLNWHHVTPWFLEDVYAWQDLQGFICAWAPVPAKRGGLKWMCSKIAK